MKAVLVYIDKLLPRREYLRYLHIIRHEHIADFFQFIVSEGMPCRN